MIPSLLRHPRAGSASAPAGSGPSHTTGRLLRVLGRLGVLLVALAIALSAAWAVLALAIGGEWPAAAKATLSAAIGTFAVAVLVALHWPRWRWRSVGAYTAAFLPVLAWYGNLQPSNHRDWQPDVAIPASADIQGRLVTVSNVRNFHYRSETDYDRAYYDRTYDLDRLRAVDLVASYWMGPAIAHTFLSFEFDDGAHLAISIETRKAIGETYSTLKGFFRQYELFYVVADERDVIRLRTNYRQSPGEDVYVYRLRAPAENARRLFLEYMHRINALNAKPAFYNTLTSNCTTTIWLNSRVNDGHVPFSWKLLASGYAPDYLYETGRLQGQLPFAKLRERAWINPRAQGADTAADFSQRIRQEPAQ